MTQIFAATIHWAQKNLTTDDTDATDGQNNRRRLSVTSVQSVVKQFVETPTADAGHVAI